MSLPKKSIPKLPEFQVSVPYLFPACSGKLTLGTIVMENQEFSTCFWRTSFCSICRPNFCFSIASQEFHLKTLERAMQHTSSFTSFSINCNNTDKVIIKLFEFSTLPYSKSESHWCPRSTDWNNHCASDT